MKVGICCSECYMLWSCIVWHEIDGVSIPMGDESEVLYDL